jgi:hypothetical protein
MVTWCMKFYLCKTKNDVDLAIYKSIEWVDYIQKSWFTKQSGYRKSCSAKSFF